MITTGIVRQINIDGGSFKHNKYLVELNIFQIPGDNNKKNYTYQANCCSIPGQAAAYKVGDVVYVGFINDDLSYPVILGNIYQGLKSDSRSYLNVEALKVSGEVQLPNNTKIGKISYKQLLGLLRYEEKQQYRHIITCVTDAPNSEYIKITITTRCAYKYSPETLPVTELYKILYANYQDTPLIVGVYTAELKYIKSGNLRVDVENSAIAVEFLDNDGAIINCKINQVIDDYVVEI